MKIKKLFRFGGYVNHMVLETVDGEYKKFYISPARKIVESDLTPVPYYRAKGKNAEEAESYIYKMYGLEK